MPAEFLIGIALSLYINLGRINVFNTIEPSDPEHGIYLSFHSGLLQFPQAVLLLLIFSIQLLEELGPSHTHTAVQIKRLPPLWKSLAVS